VLIDYLAVGLDPEKSTLYVQSDLPETAELYLLLNMFAYLGELERCVSFKEKARKHPDNVNAGLLTYPVLQAADVLIHNADKVPVGKDQQQHLEMARDFAQRFNYLFGTEYFKLPVAYNFGDELVKIPGMDGSLKMSKSDNEASCVFLSDSPEIIRKKVMKAVTDTGPTTPNQEKPQAVENLFQLMNAVSTSDTLHFFEEQYNTCQIRYGDMKKQLVEDIIAFTSPIYEKILELRSNQNYLSSVARMGAEKARASATKTVREVREIIGLRSL
jgi:tryptophanyl-tRNA synthetase